MRVFLLCLSLALAASPLTAPSVAAQDGPLGLNAPAAVIDSGLLKHILPRFSLKTGVRVRPDKNGPMVLAPAPPGTPVFQRDGIVYHLRIGNDARQDRFRDWLVSEVGKRTIDSFQPEGVALYSSDVATAVVERKADLTGDARRGGTLSQTLCGRCHAVSPDRRLNGIGSTPSFMVLRALPDWEDRFSVFYTLNPHPAFTQIADLTAPFDAERPSPIHPIDLTLDDLDDILAYVAGIEPADLGAPLQTQ